MSSHSDVLDKDDLISSKTPLDSLASEIASIARSTFFSSIFSRRHLFSVRRPRMPRSRPPPARSCVQPNAHGLSISPLDTGLKISCLDGRSPFIGLLLSRSLQCGFPLLARRTDKVRGSEDRIRHAKATVGSAVVAAGVTQSIERCCFGLADRAWRHGGLPRWVTRYSPSTNTLAVQKAGRPAFSAAGPASAAAHAWWPRARCRHLWVSEASTDQPQIPIISVQPGRHRLD